MSLFDKLISEKGLG